MLITLVRHGETDWNLAGRIQGATDIPLNDTGRAQARDTAERLRTLLSPISPETIWLAASDLSRAAVTASIMGDALGIGVPTLYPGLRERRYGDAEGMAVLDYRAQYPDTTVPGAESNDELAARLLRTLETVVADAEAHGRSRVLAATHGGVIGVLLRAATSGAVPSAAQRVRNGSVHTFDLQSSGDLQSSDELQQSGAALALIDSELLGSALARGER